MKKVATCFVFPLGYRLKPSNVTIFSVATFLVISRAAKLASLRGYGRVALNHRVEGFGNRVGQALGSAILGY